MKKIVLTILFTLSALCGWAQVRDFTQLVNKYSGRGGYTTMDFTGPLIKMMTAETGGAFEGINSIKSVMTDTADEEFLDDITATMSQEGFSKLFGVSTGEDTFHILQKEKGKGKNRDKTEYILYVNDGHDVIIVYVEGDVDLMSLRQLSTINFRKK